MWPQDILTQPICCSSAKTTGKYSHIWENSGNITYIKVLWKKFCVFCLLGISNKIQTINRSKSMLIQRTSGRTWVTLSWGWIFLSNVNYIIGDMHYLPWQCKNNNVSNKYEEGKKRKDVVRGHENGNGLRFQRKKWRNNVYPLNLYFLKCFQLLIFCINFSWGIFYERNNVS